MQPGGIHKWRNSQHLGAGLDQTEGEWMLKIAPDWQIKNWKPDRDSGWGCLYIRLKRPKHQP
jgi:hypothetical protein